MTSLREKMLETSYYNQSERKDVGDWLLRHFAVSPNMQGRHLLHCTKSL